MSNKKYLFVIVFIFLLVIVTATSLNVQEEEFQKSDSVLIKKFFNVIKAILGEIKENFNLSVGFVISEEAKDSGETVEESEEAVGEQETMEEPQELEEQVNETEEMVEEDDSEDEQENIASNETDTQKSEIDRNETEELENETTPEPETEINESESMTIPEEINNTEVDINQTISNQTEVNETITNQTLTNVSETNQTLVNQTYINTTIETKRARIIIGRPVSWLKKINKTQDENLSVELPKQAQNITIKTGKRAKEAGKKLEEYEELLREVDRNEIKKRTTTGFVSLDFGNNNKGFLIKLWEWITSWTITGRAIDEQKLQEQGKIIETDNKKQIDLTSITEQEITIEYWTDAPQSVEEETEKGKRITISAPDELNYSDVLAWTEINEIEESKIKLYHITFSGRELVDTEKFDLNKNGLIDYIEWNVPHLSEQEYELEITVLNVQSYPTLGGNWTVMFNTTGQADLIIIAVNGTTWSNSNEDNDLKFLEIRCDDEILNYSWVNNSVFISNYSCNNQTGFETSKVLTSGKHHLEFDFGGQKAWAHNWVGNPPTITWEPPTPNDGDTIDYSDVYLNTTITDNNETIAFFDWNYSLLGYWNFGSVNSTGVYDNSSYDNFGAFGTNGPDTTNVTTGRFGNALEFDGTDDYVKINNDFVGDTTSLTIASWFKKESGGHTYECVLHKGSDNTIGGSDYWLGVDNSDYLTATIGANQPDIGWSAGKTTTVATYGQWYHLVAAWDGSVVRVYINGEYDKQYNLNSYAGLTTPTRFGASADGTNYQFRGEIDEIWIWNRALSQEEISALYNNTANRLYHNFTSVSNGLYNYKAYAIDEDGNLQITQERNVTVSVEVPPTTPTPEINSTDGSDEEDQDLNCYDTITDDNEDNMNVTVRWYKDDILNLTVDYNNSYANNYKFNAVLDSGNTSSGDVWKCGMRLYGGGEYSEWGNSSDLTIIEREPPTITWEYPTPEDGNTTWNDWVYLNTTITDLTDTSAFFDWNYSLLGYWNFEETNATGVFDNSTNDNFGIFGGGLAESAKVTGKYGDALEFDGEDDYINLGDTADGDYDSMTIEAWIKRTSDTPDGWRTPLHRNDGTTVGSSVFFIGLEATSHDIVATIGAGSGAGYQAGNTDIPAVLDTWYHVVNSWDGTTARVYVDGVEKLTYGLSADDFSNKDAVTRIGASGDSSGYLFKGEVDEVKIYSRALSQEEINASYNNGLYKLYHNFTNLNLGSYNYSAYAIDEAGNLNITKERSINLEERVYPTIGLEVITPPDFNSLNVTQNDFFNASVNVSCYDANCGEINVSLDAEVSQFEVFTESGNFSVPEDVTNVVVLVVAGGGSGGTQGTTSTATGAGGGGGGGKDGSLVGSGGNGGGGDGGSNSDGNSAMNGTGGGGGGSGDSSWKGGDGGSGIVIVKYDVITSGPINTTIGATPFYTNATSNPLTTISLNQGDSEIITFWVNATGSATSETDYIFSFYSYMISDSSIWNKSEEWNVTIVEGEAVDTEYPQFSSPTESPSDPATYSSGANYEFNITITSTNGTGGIDFDGANYSLSNVSDNFYKSLTDLSANEAGYSYYYWAYGNGTSHNYNTSSIYDYTINQATSSVNLTLNGTQGNISITNNTSIDLNCSTILGDSEAYLELWNNGTLINNGTSPIGNTTLFDAVGLYNITCVYEETTNFSRSSETWWVNVTSGETAISIDLSPTLSQQISWNLASLPIYNQSAEENNGDGVTNYYVNISAEGGTADLYIKASGDLMTQGLDVLGLGNETFSYNVTNSSVPSNQKFVLTTFS